MRLRRRWFAAAWIAVGLLFGAPHDAVSEQCPSYDPAQHKSGCADVSVSPARVRPGETVTVSVNLNCSGASVYCSYAKAEGIVVDGTPVTGSGGSPPMYHGTSVYPDAGFQVPISGNGGHSVTFTIRKDAPDACVEIGEFGVSGPWVSVGAGTQWSTPVPFSIDRNAGRSVSLGMTATPPRPDEVRPGEKIEYAVTATLDATADDLRIWVPVPSGTVLVPDTISDDGVVRSNELQWRLGESGTKTVRFTAQVRDAKKLKRIDQIVANGRAQARFGRKSSSDSVRVQTKIGKPTQVRGTIYDAKLEYPRKTHIDENDPLGGVKVELRNDKDEVVDSDTADQGGRYEVEAGDTGTFTLRVETAADRYLTASNTVRQDLTVVQERKVEIAALSAAPKRLDVRVPRGILAHAAKSLHSVNNIDYSFAGIVPHTYRMDTTGIEAEIGFLTDAKEEYFLSDEPHAPNGWDALVRLSACLNTIGRRYVDMAIAVDDLAKVIPVGILIQLMQTEKDNFSEKYAGVKSLDTFANATAGSRLVEAAKITTLAYLIGNYLPPLLDELGMPPEQKAAAIELVYKLVRFGMNLFVPGMNTGDLVFEVILQAARTAIFEGGMTAARIYLQAEVDAAFTKFAQRQVGGTHSEVLAALSLFDDRVLDRSKQFHRITVDALFTISSIIRGPEGIAVKLQQAIGKDKDVGRFGKTLAKGLKPISNALGLLKKKLFIPSFVAAAAAAGGTVVLTPVDIHSEVAYAFAGFPPGARPVDLQGVNEVMDEWFGDWVRKYDPFYKPKAPEKAPKPQTTLPEFRAAIDRLGAISAQVRAKNPAAYTAAVDATVADLGALGASIVPLLDRCSEAPWNGEPRLLAFIVQGNEALLGVSQVILFADAWSFEPSAALADETLDAIAATSRELNEAGLAAEGALVALQGRTAGPRLFVSTPGLSNVPAATDLLVEVTVRNVGDAPVSAGSVELDAVPGLTLASPATASFEELAPGASVVLTWTVRTADTGPTLVNFSVVVTSPNAATTGLTESFVVAEAP